VKQLLCRMMVLAWVVALPALSHAAPINDPQVNGGSIIIGTESNTAGLVQQVTYPNSLFNWTAGSDGEVAFHPFGSLTGDLTDSMVLTTRWVSAMGPTSRWNVLADGVSWFLPAIGENEPSFTEDIGSWVLPGGQWGDQHLGQYIILSASGAISDIITTFNADDGAHILFASDSDPIPEPASLVLLSVGIAGMGWYRWRRRKAVGA